MYCISYFDWNCDFRPKFRNIPRGDITKSLTPNSSQYMVHSNSSRSSYNQQNVSFANTHENSALIAKKCPQMVIGLFLYKLVCI